MANKAAITVLRPREEVQRLWESSSNQPGGEVTFKDAPGDRGTEIHVDLEDSPSGLGAALKKLRGGDEHAKAMDGLRRFKQRVETGVIAVSEGSPEGELAERKFKQRPAQPLDESELEKAGV
jgi:uncharacterized membrane protein